MSFIIPICLAVALGLFLVAKRSPNPTQIVRSLPPADRLFLADELERITRLPLRTAEDEDAWYTATQETERRLRTRFTDADSVVPHELFHYFHDADIHRKDPSYRIAQEEQIVAFIRQLRQQT